MSIEALHWAWGVKIAAAKKLVLVKIADRANQHGACWPGQDSLAADCCVSKASLIRYIREFEEMGLLSVQKRRSDSGRQVTNLYLLNLQCQPGCKLIPGSAGLQIDTRLAGLQNAPSRVATVQPVLKEEPTVLEPKDTRARGARLPDWQKRALETDLPEWLNRTAWEAYVRHRVELKAKLTTVGVERILKKLQRMHDAGQPITRVIENAIANGWTGLFPIAQSSRRSQSDPADAIERGEALGVYPEPGESAHQFAHRVQQAAAAARH